MTKREKEAFEAMRAAIKQRVKEWHSRSANMLKKEPKSLSMMRAALIKTKSIICCNPFVHPDNCTCIAHELQNRRNNDETREGSV